MAPSPKAQTDASKLKRPALVLDLPGAPNTPHEVLGIPVELTPDQPVALEACGITLADARALDADEGCPVALVELAEKKED